MKTFTKIDICAAKCKKGLNIEVDTGSTTLTVDEDLASEIGLQKVGGARGKTGVEGLPKIRGWWGYGRVALNGRSIDKTLIAVVRGVTPVVGYVTLEQFMFKVNPHRGTLEPITEIDI